MVFGKQDSPGMSKAVNHLGIGYSSSTGGNSDPRLIKLSSQVICLLSCMWKENHTDASSFVIINECIKPGMGVHTFDPST